jgi:broad specificity phosphatase PhoE
MMAENKLLLIRHSMPEVRSDIPSTQWALSEGGCQRCISLSEKLRPYRPGTVVTSTERKAIETGDVIAQVLSIPVNTAAGLHEHDRKDIGLLSQENFEAMQRLFFAQPFSRIFGKETAQQALQRFSGALTGVLENYPSGTLAIVSHATVITLWVTGLIGGDPFAFWKRLGMPAYVVFSRPDMELVELVEYVE